MGETRWLDAEEMRAWRGYLGLVRLLDHRLNRDLQEQSGLTLSDYEILVRLAEEPARRMRMSELAERAMISKSRLSHQITRLADRGLTRRERCPSDRRGSFAVLTDAGYAALEAAAPGHAGSVRAHLIDVLNPEQVCALAELSEAVVTRLDRTGRRRV
ncbi:MarR family transcriptional regulator [soil metagenome]